MIPHIKILILNWNGSALTIQCLTSIEKLTYGNFSTMVIDNASTDDSIASIHKIFPSVEILAMDKNYGFGPAYNLAFKHLRISPSDYVLILNNDTTLESNLLEKLLEGVDKFGTEHLYCPMIHYLDYPDRIWYAGGIVNLPMGIITHAGLRHQDRGLYTKIVQTGYATGCCIFVSSKTIQDLNGFNEEFNMYVEDVDLSLRGIELGIKSIFVPQAKVHHKVSASIGGELSISKIKRKLYSVNKLMTIHCTTPERLRGFPLYILRTLIGGILYVLMFLKR